MKDTIYRQDAIEHCKKRLYESALNNVGVMADDVFSEIADNRIETWLNELPSVEKTGKWIGDKCSVCGEERAWYGCNPNYCPDCGAKMEVKDE